MKNVIGKILNKMWKIVRVIWILVIIVGISECTKSTTYIESRVREILLTSFITILYVAIEVLRYGYQNRCLSCKRWFALKKIGKTFEGSEDISVAVKGKTYGNDGKQVGYQEQYVPGTKNIYHMNYQCKYCGRTCYSEFSKKVAKI